MEFDLQRGLRDLSSTPAVTPDVPVERVLTRVHRGRALRATAVGVASLAVVVGAAVAVYAAPWQPVPPVVTPTPTIEPTPTPTPDVTPDPTPSAAPTPVPELQLVALTSAGDIVVIDPATGGTDKVLASGLPIATSNPCTLALSPDGAVAYVDSADRQVLRVTLADGTTEVVADGFNAEVSPDGLTLAFAGRDDDAGWGTGLWLLDLATGSRRHIPDELAVADAPRVTTGPAWSPDGGTVYVANGWDEGSSILAVDVAGTARLGDARVVGPQDDALSWATPSVRADGSLAVFVRDMGFEPTDASMNITFVDPATGAPGTRIDTPGRWVADLAAHPTDGSLVVVFTDGALAIWDGSELREVAAGFEAAVWHVATG